jgi:hypothetical protein
VQSRAAAVAVQFVVVTVRLTVRTAVPLELRSVIVTVAVPARSARSCHDTFRLAGRDRGDRLRRRRRTLKPYRFDGLNAMSTE